MKRLIKLWPVALILLLVATPAMASVIDSALYNGKVRVANSANTTASNVSVNFTLNSDDFISNGFANSTMSDIAMQRNGVDIPCQPGYSDEDWILFVDEISAGQNVDYDLYSVNATDGKSVYFPDTAGMAADDDEALELGANFTVEQKGFWDTSSGSNKYSVYKSGALEVENDANETITATMAGDSTEIGDTSTTKGINAGRVQAEAITLPAGTVTHLSINIATQAGQKSDWLFTMILRGTPLTFSAKLPNIPW